MDPKDLSLRQLRTELKRLSLSPSGLKASLVTRLKAALAKEGRDTIPLANIKKKKTDQIKKSSPEKKRKAPVELKEDVIPENKISEPNISVPEESSKRNLGETSSYRTTRQATNMEREIKKKKEEPPLPIPPNVWDKENFPLGSRFSMMKDGFQSESLALTPTQMEKRAQYEIQTLQEHIYQLKVALESRDEYIEFLQQQVKLVDEGIEILQKNPRANINTEVPFEPVINYLTLQTTL
jgi:hypothetical protein